MRAIRQALAATFAFALIAATALILSVLTRDRPQDLPWTPLDLGRPIGAFTGRKLAGLTEDAPRCRALLRAAGVNFVAVPPLREGSYCAYADGVRLEPGGARTITLTPAVTMSCPVAAGLAMWEWDVVQPAAQRHFGMAVKRIEHLGSYSCRRIYGSSAGEWSEHATADAIDVAAFVLADGRRVSVLSDWKGDAERAGFLHDVRSGACRLFATVLSPDYNSAHRDHLHLDQANRGMLGWRSCR